MSALEVVFWAAIGLLVYAHLGYPLALRALVALIGAQRARVPELPDDVLPRVSLIIAAHDSADRTAELARAAGADLALELPRGGKVAALNAAVERSRGEVLAFSDANSLWEPDALRRLVARLAEPSIGYVCGRLSLVAPRGVGADRADAGANQEGLYWRYETAVRELESRLPRVTP